MGRPHNIDGGPGSNIGGVSYSRLSVEWERVLTLLTAIQWQRKVNNSPQPMARPPMMMMTIAA